MVTFGFIVSDNEYEYYLGNGIIVSNNNNLDYCQWIIVSELWYKYFELW